MRRTLADPGARAEVLRRLRALRPDSERRWGSLTPAEMMCHLADSFALGLGEREADGGVGTLRRVLFTWVALELPVPWPKGVPTRPTMDPRRQGTPPADWYADRERLVDAIERFAANGPAPHARHPLFGRLSRRRWLKWGWRHADHHLRQFGL